MVNSEPFQVQRGALNLTEPMLFLLVFIAYLTAADAACSSCEPYKSLKEAFCKSDYGKLFSILFGVQRSVCFMGIILQYSSNIFETQSTTQLLCRVAPPSRCGEGASNDYFLVLFAAVLAQETGWVVFCFTKFIGGHCTRYVRGSGKQHFYTVPAHLLWTTFGS
ncbi:hypothetical protein Y032_0310g2117 [Ancylostoma ceylanicum]|uniref:Uncharacterized protein n=1 Tax=Ancylostoma ceylanicum TaxID=53326 RepID=A0A016S2Q4_9BILA|nr:hypothetical protein Y032_0310g2117 [Ancylostoma ceylanicum]